MKARNTQLGFTLPEVLAALTIAGVLVALAAPGFGSLMQDTRMTSQTNAFIANLNLARAEALKRGQPVTVCVSSDQASCSAAATWEDGFIMFVNADDDSPPVVDAGETLLRVSGDTAPGLTVRSADFASAISFRPVMFAGTSGTFTLCDARGAGEARGVLVSGTGRAYVSRDFDDDGVHEDRNGNDLACP